MSNKLKQLSTEELATVCRGMIEARDKRIAELEGEVKAVRETKRAALKAWNVAVDERDEARRELAAERARLVQAGIDIRNLLVNLDALQEQTGEWLGDDDLAVVEDILARAAINGVRLEKETT